MPARIGPFNPDYAIAPGETLREELEGLQMTQAELAERTGLSTKHVNQIVQGIAPLTTDTAVALGRVTTLSADVWSNLEAQYQVARAHLAEAEDAERDREWIAKFPLSALEKRRFIRNKRDYLGTRHDLLTFFGVASRSVWEARWIAPEASFRRSRAYRVDDYATACWLRIGERKAQSTKTEEFDAGRFRAALSRIRRSMTSEPSTFVPLMKQSCQQAGVVVVLEKEITGSRAHGAVRWVAAGKALLQLSDRRKAEDAFWFTFFHEAGHLLLHGRRDPIIEYDSAAKDEQEKEADRFAERLLVPEEEEPRLRGLRTEAEIVAFADEMRLPPGVVLGRLQYGEEVIPPHRFNHLRRRLEIVDPL
jgi:HTH-type transcriptional regulator/antitoxin HigA